MHEHDYTLAKYSDKSTGITCHIKKRSAINTYTLPYAWIKKKRPYKYVRTRVYIHSKRIARMCTPNARKKNSCTRLAHSNAVKRRPRLVAAMTESTHSCMIGALGNLNKGVRAA